jgi:adenosine deaminase CECR1
LNYLRSSRLRLLLLCLLCFGMWPTVSTFAADSHFDGYFEKLKQDPGGLKAFLKRMPKGGELHSHLSGAVPFERLLDVATRHGYSVAFSHVNGDVCGFTLPGRAHEWKGPCKGAALDTTPAKDLSADERERLHRALTVAIGGSDRDESSGFGQFNLVFDRLNELTDNADVIPDLVQEVMQEASANNVSYLELRVNPIGRKDSVGRSVPIEALITRLEAFVAEKNKQLGKDHEVVVKFIIGLQRQSPDRAGGITNLPPIACSIETKCSPRLRQAYFLAARRYTGVVVGLDLVGLPEVDSTAEFSALRREFGDASITLHAGETLDPERQGHIASAILNGARRIGHGFNMEQSPEAKQLICDRQIPLEVSLTSNLLLGLVPRDDLKTHPFPRYFREEICSNDIRSQYGHLPVTLNTDDAGIFQTDLTNEFFLAITTFDLSWDEVKQLSRNSLSYSFANDAERLSLLQRWEREITELESTAGTHKDAEFPPNMGRPLKNLFFWIFGSTVVQSFLGPLLLLIFYGCLYWVVLRFRGSCFVVVSDFRIWGKLGKDFPDKGVAERFKDELTQLADEMATPDTTELEMPVLSGPPSPVASIPPLPPPKRVHKGNLTFPGTQVTLEYKGISMEALHTFVRRLAGREFVITGDLIDDPSGPRIAARATRAGLWELLLEGRDSATLQLGLRRLALRVLTTMTNQFQRKAADILVRLQIKARELRDYEQAFYIAQLGMKDPPDPDKAKWNLAVAHADIGLKLAAAGQYDGAVEHFKAAADLYPTFVQAWDALHVMYEEIGRPQDAIKAHQMAEDIRTGVNNRNAAN